MSSPASWPWQVLRREPGLFAGITTRAGGVSPAPWDSLNLGLHVGDDPLAVAENRRRLRAYLPAEPLWLDQVHGTDVFDADQDVPPVHGLAPRADASLTREPGRVLAIMTADCLPVIVHDQACRVLGMAHAGWRGLLAGVVPRLIDRMGVEPSKLRVVVGPGIGPRGFEVGPEVAEAFSQAWGMAALAQGRFVRADPPHPGWRCDLAGLLQWQLSQMGCHDVWCDSSCTWSDAQRWFSHRRQAPCGRMLTVAWLSGSAV